MDMEQSIPQATNDGLDRDAAMARSKTILPVSETVEVEALPDEQIATQHINGGVIANIESDAERTLSDGSATFASSSNGSLKVVLLVAGVAIAVGTALVFAFFSLR